MGEGVWMMWSSIYMWAYPICAYSCMWSFSSARTRRGVSCVSAAAETLHPEAENALDR